jgi:pilus assembly protein CpaE
VTTPVPRILVVDSAGDLVEPVRAAADWDPAPEVTVCSDLRRAEVLVAQGRFDVLVAGPSSVNRGGLRRLAALHRREPCLSLLLAVDSRPDASLREIIQVGADDILPAAIDEAELAIVLERSLGIARRRRAAAVVENAPALSPPPPRGRIITVVSPTGGGGKTFLATNLALFLARQTGKRVVLVDLDLQFGEVSVALRLRADFTISDVVRHGAEDGELQEHLSEFLVPHREGFSVLAAPRSPAEADAISAADITRLLEILKDRADYVVVDTPPALNDAVLAALDLSDQLLALATADVPSVHNLRVFLRTMDRLRVPPESISLILNKAEPDVGFDPGQVAGLFPQGFAAILPYDREVSRSINLGTPILAAHPEADISRKLIPALATFLPEGEWRALDPPVSPKWTSKLRRRRAAVTPPPEPAPIVPVPRFDPETVAPEAIEPVSEQPFRGELVLTEPAPLRPTIRRRVRNVPQNGPPSRRPERGPAGQSVPRRRLRHPEARSPPRRVAVPPVRTGVH